MNATAKGTIMRLALAVGSVLALAACGGDSTGPSASFTPGSYVLVASNGGNPRMPGQLTLALTITAIADRGDLTIAPSSTYTVGPHGWNVDAYALGLSAYGAYLAFRISRDGQCLAYSYIESGRNPEAGACTLTKQ